MTDNAGEPTHSVKYCSSCQSATTHRNQITEDGENSTCLSCGQVTTLWWEKFEGLLYEPPLKDKTKKIWYAQ